MLQGMCINSKITPSLWLHMLVDTHFGERKWLSTFECAAAMSVLPPRVLVTSAQVSYVVSYLICNSVSMAI